MDVGLIELASAVLGGGALTAAIGYAGARVRARSAEKIAETIRDERVAPPLLDRINTLEGRLDERRSEITELQAGRAECDRRADACEQRSKELSARVDGLERELEQRDEDITRRVRVAAQVAVRETIHSTPPGAWTVDLEEDGADPESAAGRGESPPIRSLAAVSGSGPKEK